MSAIVKKCGYQLFCPLELREGHSGWRLAYKKCSAKWPPCLGATHDHTQKREFHSVQYWREEILETILEFGIFNMQKILNCPISIIFIAYYCAVFITHHYFIMFSMNSSPLLFTTTQKQSLQHV